MPCVGGNLTQIQNDYEADILRCPYYTIFVTVNIGLCVDSLGNFRQSFGLNWRHFQIQHVPQSIKSKILY